MGETGNDSGSREAGGEVIVNAEANKNRVNPETQAEAKKMAERVDKIYRLRTRLKTAKSKVTRT